MQPIAVLVTGGGRGIGRAIALRFGRERASVVVAARTASEIERVAREVEGVGGRALAVPLDVTEASSVQDGVTRALDFAGGTLDVLVNNAGIFSIEPFPEISPATWQRTLATNLTGPFLVTRAALRGLRRSSRAHVFNVSSIAGRQAFPGNAAYCASKFGLRGFSDALRMDLASSRIRVSTVYPSATDTSIFDGVPGDWDRELMHRPEDVAERVWQAFVAPGETDVEDLVLEPLRPRSLSE